MPLGEARDDSGGAYEQKSKRCEHHDVCLCECADVVVRGGAFAKETGEL